MAAFVSVGIWKIIDGYTVDAGSALHHVRGITPGI